MEPGKYPITWTVNWEMHKAGSTATHPGKIGVASVDYYHLQDVVSGCWWMSWMINKCENTNRLDDKIKVKIQMNRKYWPPP